MKRRMLSIETAYEDAGIAVRVNPDHGIIDDSDSGFESWTAAELHDMMERHFSRFGGAWPNWHMWSLLAGTYERPSVGVVMFDVASHFGGAGKAPERQGFALFRKHSWFNRLGDGSEQERAKAMRHFGG